jgi:hypothetical protein
MIALLPASRYRLIASLTIALWTAQPHDVLTQTTAPTQARIQRIHPRITEFENILWTAVKLGVLQSLKSTKPGEVIFSEPIVDGLRPPVPQGGLLFVVQMTPLRWPVSRGPMPELDTQERIRNALIDAMVGSAGNLPLESNEWLTVVGLSVSNSSVKARTLRLYLSIRG